MTTLALEHFLRHRGSGDQPARPAPRHASPGEPVCEHMIMTGPAAGDRCRCRGDHIVRHARTAHRTCTVHRSFYRRHGGAHYRTAAQ